MKYPAYPKYKPSGVEWVERIPASWDARKIKFLASAPIKNGVGEAADHDEPQWPRYVRITDLAGPRNLRDDTFRSLPPEVARDAPIRIGDILLAAVGATYGKSYLHSKETGPACFAGYLVRFSPGPLLVAEYAAYWTESSAYWNLVQSRVVQATIQNFSAAKYRELCIPLPPIAEQRAIADFLDVQTAKLDTLVGKKRELIEKLKEKRSALISRTVTRGLPPEAACAAGLDPNPNFKPSGIEWLGEVPEHWDVVQLFRFTAAIQTGPFGSQLHQSDYVDEGVPLINPSHLIEDRIVPDDQDTVTDETARRLMRHRLMAGDVVFARRGEIGRCAVVGEEESGWLCGTGSMIIRLRDCDARYFARVFRSAGFSALLTLNAVGTTMLNLNPSIVGRMRVPQPPLPEQCAISDYLDRETSKMDRMVEKVEAAIERLQEYRTGLITAAVTGKIDVRTKH